MENITWNYMYSIILNIKTWYYHDIPYIYIKLNMSKTALVNVKNKISHSNNLNGKW